MDLFNTRKVKEMRGEMLKMQKAMNSNLLTNISANILSQSIAQYPTYSESRSGIRYSTFDDIYSIINKLVGASISIPMYPFYEKSGQAAKQLKRFPIEGNVFERKALQYKALEDLPDSDPVAKLLDNPSNYQNNVEFWTEAYTWLYLRGRSHLVKMRPENGVNKGKPTALEVLIPDFLIPKVAKAYPRNIITGYDYVIDGIKVMENIPVDDIITVKYFNPQSPTDGLSPLEVLRNRLTRLQSNMDRTVTQMQNGGPIDIVYEKDEDVGEVGVAGQHKENFYKFTSDPGNRSAPYWAGSGELGVIRLGVTLADLDAAELANIDFKKLCNVWSLSDRLFNNDATGSEISDKNARRSLYTDGAMPNAIRFAAAIESSLNEDFKDKRRVINADISGIPELQPDSQTLATWLSTAWWITPNEKREMQKFDKLADPLFDKPLVPTGLVSLDDLQGAGDLPLTQDYSA